MKLILKLDIIFIIYLFFVAKDTFSFFLFIFKYINLFLSYLIFIFITIIFFIFLDSFFILRLIIALKLIYLKIIANFYVILKVFE